MPHFKDLKRKRDRRFQGKQSPDIFKPPRLHTQTDLVGRIMRKHFQLWNLNNIAMASDVVEGTGVCVQIWN